MANFYAITYPGEKHKVLPEVGYTYSFYLQDRIDGLSKTTVCQGWEVIDQSDAPEKRRKEHLGMDGGTIYVDKKWGLKQDQRVTTELMSTFNKLWILIEMNNVHEITYYNDAKEPKIGYTNSQQLIERIEKELLSESWKCDPFLVKEEKHLEAMQNSDGKCVRCIRGALKNKKILTFQHGGGGGRHDQEGGDDGWCSNILYFTIFPVDLGAHMAEVKTEEGVTIDMVKEEMESTVDDTVGEALEGTLARSKKLSERAVTT